MKVKDRNSDEENDDAEEIELGDMEEEAPSRGTRARSKKSDSAITHDKKDKPMSAFEREKAELEAAPVIPDSEISPAAFIFALTEEER